jgi:hypothetical protein
MSEVWHLLKTRTWTLIEYRLSDLAAEVQIGSEGRGNWDRFHCLSRDSIAPRLVT